MEKASSVGSVTKYDDMIDAVGNNMTTNLTFDDIKSLISYGTSGKPEIQTLSLAGRDYMPSDTYYYQLDGTALTELKHKLQRHLGVSISDKGSEITQTYNSPSTNNLGTDPANNQNANSYGEGSTTGQEQSYQNDSQNQQSGTDGQSAY